MIIRPLAPHEIQHFAQTVGHAERADSVLEYMEQMLRYGSMRLDWCFVLEEADQFRGGLGFWTLPSHGKPLACVLLEVPWQRTDYLTIGTQLFQHTFPLMQAQGAQTIEYVLDTPPMKPQWQHFPEQRVALLEQVGFKVERETFRFTWQSHYKLPVVSSRLIFRNLVEAGDATFIEAIERVSAQTFDARILQEREQNGPVAQARSMFEDIQMMDYQPDWWQLAYTQSGALVGLIMPARNPGGATIGYIGVVPEFRGRGYVDDLLAQGTVILHQAGFPEIRADTDVANVPMANAFLRAGYTQFARRHEYEIRLDSVKR